MWRRDLRVPRLDLLSGRMQFAASRGDRSRLISAISDIKLERSNEHKRR